MKEKITDLIQKTKLYWKEPPKGRYMTYKEIASLSVGGIGVRLIVYCYAQMIISTGNVLLANTIGIDPIPLYAIYIISLLSGFPLTALRARMIDNTRSMKGKYRPYIIKMGIPTTVLGIGFMIMPYERMSLFVKCAVVLAYNIGFQFFYNFFNDSYDSLINVLSPNSIERSDVLSIKSVVENISPSIVNLIFPLLAKLITGQNTLYDLRVYRLTYPIMLAFGMLMSILVYANTEEKIVQAKSHFIQIRFIDAFRAVAANKYFWIISLAGWIGFLENAFGSILQWMYNYQGACSAGQYTLIVAITGNASFWPNLVAPFLIRKYGKKKILIWSNLLNIVFIAAMIPVVRRSGSAGTIWLLLVIIFINTFLTALGHLLTPSINADIRDYQQYITGERIDGMFAAVGLIGNIITMATGLVLPYIYDKVGLNKETAIMLGYDGSNVYNVLYNPDYFRSICTVLIVASVVGAAMNVIPFFFFDLSEMKQKAMIKVLKVRAMFEDFGNGALADETLKDGGEIIAEAKEFYGKAPNDISGAKEKLKEIKRTDKQAYKAAKEELKRQKDENEKIEIAGFIMNELGRFSTAEGRVELENAKLIANAGLDGFLKCSLPDISEAKAMPKSTEAEKSIRRDTIMQIRNFAVAKKTAAKYYPDGIKKFDENILVSLFEREDKLRAELSELAAEMKNAKETNAVYDMSDIREKTQALKKEKAQAAKEIKKASAENSVYHRAAKPYLDAVRILAQAENYGRLDEIAAMYEKVKE